MSESIKFEIKETLGVLQSHDSGWAKELNLVAWNEAPIKFDIRDWDPFHQRMKRGVTLSKEEGYRLYQLLKTYFEKENVLK